MPSPFADLFLTADPASAERLRALVDRVIDALAASRPNGPRSDLTPEALTRLAATDPGLDEIVAHGVVPSHPLTAAHLLPPAHLAALAAEVAVAATNQSLVTHDQAPWQPPSELRLVGWLARRSACQRGRPFSSPPAGRRRTSSA